jgi:hypothetical protein
MKLAFLIKINYSQAMHINNYQTLFPDEFKILVKQRISKALSLETNRETNLGYRQLSQLVENDDPSLYETLLTHIKNGRTIYGLTFKPIFCFSSGSRLWRSLLMAKNEIHKIVAEHHYPEGRQRFARLKPKLYSEAAINHFADLTPRLEEPELSAVNENINYLKTHLVLALIRPIKAALIGELSDDNGRTTPKVNQNSAAPARAYLLIKRTLAALGAYKSVDAMISEPELRSIQLESSTQPLRDTTLETDDNFVSRLNATSLNKLDYDAIHRDFIALLTELIECTRHKFSLKLPQEINELLRAPSKSALSPPHFVIISDYLALLDDSDISWLNALISEFLPQYNIGDNTFSTQNLKTKIDQRFTNTQNHEARHPVFNLCIAHIEHALHANEPLATPAELQAHMGLSHFDALTDIYFSSAFNEAAFTRINHLFNANNLPQIALTTPRVSSPKP